MQPPYQTIIEQLQAAFPGGTVVETGKNQAYIPVQAYIARLEAAAAGEWEWRLIGDPTIYPEDHAICVRGELSIAGTVRSGVGFSYYARNEEARSVSTFKNAVNSAESDAIRNACDKFLMGWKDLARYRDWASNPGVGITQGKAESEMTDSLLCLKCKKPLSAEDQLFLQVNNIRNNFCTEHVPKHFLKNK